MKTQGKKGKKKYEWGKIRFSSQYLIIELRGPRMRKYTDYSGFAYSRGIF